MVQDRHPLSKAFKSAIFFEMPKKLNVVVTLCFVHFSLCWRLSKLDIKNAFSCYISARKWYNLEKFIINPLKGLSLKYEAVSASYISPLCFLDNIHFKLAIHFSLEEKIVKNYFYLSSVEVSIPEGNFDIFGVSFFASLGSPKSDDLRKSLALCLLCGSIVFRSAPEHRPPFCESFQEK
jgi:hypothetical protein